MSVAWHCIAPLIGSVDALRNSNLERSFSSCCDERILQSVERALPSPTLSTWRRIIVHIER
jgi:hypothetical protein